MTQSFSLNLNITSCALDSAQVSLAIMMPNKRLFSLKSLLVIFMNVQLKCKIWHSVVAYLSGENISIVIDIKKAIEGEKTLNVK